MAIESYTQFSNVLSLHVSLNARDHVSQPYSTTGNIIGLYVLICFFKTEEHRKLIALEMDYLRRSARVSRLQKIPNTIFRSKMQAEQSILDRIQKRQLNWNGHLLRMAKEDLSVEHW